MLGQTQRAAVHVVRRAFNRANVFGRRPATRFLIAPPDLRTADPTIASDIYAGQFVFAGQLVTTDGLSPFDVAPPSAAWRSALLGFGWLRHLAADRQALSLENAHALLLDFLQRRPERIPAATDPMTTSRRLMSLLAQSPFMLAGASHETYVRYLKAVCNDAARLQSAFRRDDRPEVRLTVAIALTAFGLSVEGVEAVEHKYGELVARELAQQILPDGAHVSRNVRVLTDLMLDLLPLRSAYAARGIDPPGDVLDAMDRIIPHLRMMRHPDGSLALFNGMGATQVDVLATLFASHGASTTMAAEAPFGGYQRMEAGAAVLLADVGGPPPFAASGEACAGLLAFEFSDGPTRLIVNCGAPRAPSPELAPLLRATAAHSTITVADTSALRFVRRGDETRIAGRGSKMDIRRDMPEGAQRLAMSHDAYAGSHRLDVQRVLSLSADGRTLAGIDSATALNTHAAPASDMVIRFHLHPSIRADRMTSGGVRLVPLRGAPWHFTCERAHLSVEDSVFFASADGTRRARQIVLIPATEERLVHWRLVRQDD